MFRIRITNMTIGKSLKSWSRKCYGLLYFDENFSRIENLLKCWISSVFPILQIFNPLYLEKFSSKYSKSYLFWTNFSSSFQWCYSFFNWINLKNWYFLAFQELDCTHLKMTSQKHVPHFSELGPGHFQKTYIHRNVIPKGFCVQKMWSKLLKRTLFWLDINKWIWASTKLLRGLHLHV